MEYKRSIKKQFNPLNFNKKGCDFFSNCDNFSWLNWCDDEGFILNLITFLREKNYIKSL